MKKIKLIATTLTSSVLTLAIAANQPTQATVPGNNILAGVSSSGDQLNQQIQSSDLSADGRYVVFSTTADNMVTGDTNAKEDVFLRDTQTNITTRVSVSPSGSELNNSSRNPKISYDGRYVVFESKATNIISGSTPTTGAYIHDRNTGTTELVSRGLNGNPYTGSLPNISADGRFIVYQGNDRALWSNSSGNVGTQIITKDTVKGSAKLISADGSGNPGNSSSSQPSINCDGGMIAFTSKATNLTSNDTNGFEDVFVSLGAADEELANLTHGGNNNSSNSQVSCDGNYIAFNSYATNLVGSDTNNKEDVFRYSNINKTTSVVSKSSSGQLGNTDSRIPSISGDGRYVSFESTSSNFISGLWLGGVQIWVVDTKTSTIELLSIDSAGNSANNRSWESVISNDGKRVLFHSKGTNLVSPDNNGAMEDIFVAETGF